MEGDQLILEAFHGAGEIGYAAVDQIHENKDGAATNCETVPVEAAPVTTTAAPTTVTPPIGFHPCNFEESTCGWYSSSESGLSWRRGSSNDFGDQVPHPNGDTAGDPNGKY
jgi:hypothetical protein